MDIEQLQQICLQQPGATEAVKWGSNLVFAVGTKMFCIADLDGEFAFSLKVPSDQFEDWCARPGAIPAPYLAKAGWIKLVQPANFSLKEISNLVAQSYRLVLAKVPKKQRAELGLL